MFGGKFTKTASHRTVRSLKNNVAHRYHKTKQFLGHVDHGIRVAKQVYSALAAAIEHYGEVLFTSTWSKELVDMSNS